MNRLQLAVIAVPAIVTLMYAARKAKRMYREYQDHRIKQHQIATRVNSDNNEKFAAVQKLEAKLKCSLIDISQLYKGYIALRMATIKVEAIYYEWLSENYGLFHATENSVRITRIHNGFFQYELPPELKQFTNKGSRK